MRRCAGEGCHLRPSLLLLGMIPDAPPPRALAAVLLLALAQAEGWEATSSSSHGTAADDGLPSMSRLPTISRIRQALGAQNFRLLVSDGGAATLVSSPPLSSGANIDGGPQEEQGQGQGQQHLTTISSGWSSPGPVWNEFREFKKDSGAAAAGGWRVTVDRSRAAEGVWLVRGEHQNFTVQRAYVLDPPPPQRPRRVLVNDTLSTHTATAAELGSSNRWSATPTHEDVIGISVRHRATVAATAAEVESAVVPGEWSRDLSVVIVGCGRDRG
jgi:hypothetical protein